MKLGWCAGKCLFILWLLTNSLTATSATRIDSLQQFLVTANDSLKLVLYNELSYVYYNLDIQKAIKYDSAGLLLAKKNKKLREEGMFLNNLGSDYYGLSDFSQSHFYFSNAKLIFTELNDTSYLVKTYNNLGLIYQALGFYKLSADNFAKAIQIKRIIGEPASLITTLNNVAVLYNKVGLHEEALTFLQEALILAETFNDSTLKSLTYQDMGLLYLSLNEHHKSITYNEKALVALPLNRINEQCSILTNLALAYEGLGDRSMAGKFFQRATALFLDGVNDYEKANTMVYYATFLNTSGLNAGALEVALEALALTNRHEFAEIEGSLYELLARIYQQKKDFQSALVYLIKSNSLNDSIHNKNLTSSLMLISLNEKMIQINQEQQQLENENLLQAQQINYSSKLINIMITASLLLVLLLIIIMYYVTRKRKDNKKLLLLNNQLSESEEKYKAVVEQSPQIMLIHQGGKLLFANQHFYQLSGFSNQELATLSVFDLVMPEEKGRITQMARERMAGILPQSSYEFRAHDKNNNEFFLDMSFSRITYNNQPAILGIGTDISSRKKNLETIKKLTAAIEQSPIMILITDRSGVIEYVNPSFSKITGYTSEEVIGKNPNILSSGQVDTTRYRELWKTIESGEIWRGELLNKNKAGDTYWESLVISPILDENDAITHFVAIMEDISQRKVIEEALQQREEALRQANITKDKFFSIIAHDLKNPFNAIIGFSSLLTAEYHNLNDEERVSYIENIGQAANTTYQLLENLLEWARTQTGKIKFTPVVFDLYAIVNEVMSQHQTQAHKKGLKLVSEVPTNTLVNADKNMIRTVLRNLFSNAIKFSSENEIRITAKQTNGDVEVCIIDSGIGISSDGIGKLFRLDEQYLAEGTAYEKGTGLGLILSKEFITKHGGSIWVKSKENIGSRFYFSLPRQELQN